MYRVMRQVEICTKGRCIRPALRAPSLPGIVASFFCTEDGWFLPISRGITVHLTFGSDVTERKECPTDISERGSGRILNRSIHFVVDCVGEGGLVTPEVDSSHTLNRLQGEREVPAWDGSHSGNRLSHANCSFDPLTLPLNVLWWVFVGNSVRLVQH